MNAINNSNINIADSSRLISPVYAFSSDSFEKERQFQAYRDEFAAFSVVTLPPGKAEQDGFQARRVGYRLGGLRIAISETDAFSFESHTSRALLRDDQYWVLILRMQGCADIDFGDRVARYGSGSIELRRGDRPVRGQVTANKSMFVYLPKAELSGVEGLMEGLDSAHNERPMHALLSQYFVALGGTLPHLTLSEARAVAETTLATVRTCVTYLPDSGAQLRVPLMATRFQMAKKYIQDNLTSPRLTAEEVAAVLAVSRRQLYYIFEDVGGFYSFVRSLRLEACGKALLEGRAGRSINSIAAEFGFAEPASFSRAFRAHFGCSPSDFRARTMTPTASSYMTFLRPN